MKTLKDLKATILQNPEFKAEYDALASEFDMARELVAARNKAGLTDFKASTLVNMSEAPGLLEVPELAEYKAGAMEDSASTFKLATFGRVMHLSRQALVMPVRCADGPRSRTASGG